MSEKDTPNFRLKLWKLFLSTLYLSAFTFGGGYVIVTLMKKKFVDEYRWIGEDEMLDLVAIAQSSPGAIAVNASILVGWRIGNFPGMLVAVLGTIIPPIVILSAISLFYNAFISNIYIKFLLLGMQAGVAAVILNVVMELATPILKSKQILAYFFMFGAFAATFFFHINVIVIILSAAGIGIVSALFHKGGKQQ